MFIYSFIIIKYFYLILEEEINERKKNSFMFQWSIFFCYWQIFQISKMKDSKTLRNFRRLCKQVDSFEKLVQAVHVG